MDDDDADGDVVGADEAYDLDDVGELNLATMVVADHASTVTATSRTTPKPVSTKAFRRALGSGMRTIPCRGRDRGHRTRLLAGPLLRAPDGRQEPPHRAQT